MYLNSDKVIKLFTIWYSGVILYLLKTSIQASLLRGGIIPINGFQSVIDKPDSVSLVKPPITIIKKVIKVNISSQIDILKEFRRLDWNNCIKDIYLLEIIIKVVN